MSMTNVAGLSKTAASRNFIQNESSRYTSTGENSRVSLVESLLVFATVGGRSRTRPIEYCSSKENTRPSHSVPEGVGQSEWVRVRTRRGRGKYAGPPSPSSTAGGVALLGVSDWTVKVRVCFCSLKRWLWHFAVDKLFCNGTGERETDTNVIYCTVNARGQQRTARASGENTSDCRDLML